MTQAATQVENPEVVPTAGLERLTRAGFPTSRDEEWRFTPPAAIIRALGRPATAPDTADAHLLASVREVVARGVLPGAAVAVYVDGFFLPGVSFLADLPAGVEVGGSSSLDPAALVSPVPEVHAFADLNRALGRDGALVRVAPRVVCDRPIQLVFLTTTGAAESDGAAGPGAVAFPRNLIEIGEGAMATIVERHESLGEGEAAAVSWTTLRVAERGVLDHYRLEKDGARTVNVGVQQAWVGRSASFSSHAFALGAAISRQDVQCFLEGEGGEAILNGLYLVTGSRHADTHMRVEHRAAHCASHELYKGILDGKARAVFNGRIFVHRGAQKTDAKQTNRNLLLSPEALVNTNPQLEIFADDVRCTHGSTVGQLDETAIFYLRSRGIGEAAAKSLLTYAFASDVVERVKPEALRHELEEHLFAWLPMGEVVRDAV